jgi:hypothetical protein
VILGGEMEQDEIRRGRDELSRKLAETRDALLTGSYSNELMDKLCNVIVSWEALSKECKNSFHGLPGHKQRGRECPDCGTIQIKKRTKGKRNTKIIHYDPRRADRYDRRILNKKLGISPFSTIIDLQRIFDPLLLGSERIEKNSNRETLEKDLIRIKKTFSSLQEKIIDAISGGEKRGEALETALKFIRRLRLEEIKSAIYATK